MQGDTEVDGVPTYVEPMDGAHVEATLSFMVGISDETYRTVGVTHLVEHLAVWSARRSAVQFNAQVDWETTTFLASGTPAGVVKFFEDVCRALTNLPVDRLPREARVLATEGASPSHPIAAVLLHARHGYQQSGLALGTGPGPDRIDATTVQQFADTWFTRRNCVLTIRGAVPADLRLPLLDRSPPAHEYADVTPVGAPFAVEGLEPWPGAGVLLRLPGGDQAFLSFLVTSLVEDRIEEVCRHQLGESYDVHHEVVSADRRDLDVVVFADCRPGSVEEVADAFLTQLRDLATVGPTEDEVSFLRDRESESRSSPDAIGGKRVSEIMADLSGRVRAEDWTTAEVAGLEAEQLRAAVARTLASAVVYVGRGAGHVAQRHGFPPRAWACTTVAELPPGRRFRPRLAARTLSGDARRAVVVLTEDGLAEQDGAGIHVVPFSEVVGVELDPNGEGPEMTVFGRTGCMIGLDDRFFPGSRVALDAVHRHVPSALIFQRSALDPDD